MEKQIFFDKINEKPFYCELISQIIDRFNFYIFQQIKAG